MVQPKERGHLHPITHVINDIVRIFDELGFTVADGPEVETEHYNFDALNVPPNHPARDMWDTFWLKTPIHADLDTDSRGYNISENPPKSQRKSALLLRTHTSPVQIRYMEKNAPPISIIVPGKVFRYEATDATHEAQFYQLEGLMIDKDITLATMKGVLEVFFSKFFKKEMHVRLRPSYFPFVEPGAEIDMSCFKCSPVKILEQNLGGQGQDNEAKTCGLCKGNGYIELAGAGMVHPVVLNNVGIDPRKWQGFAFGFGIDRLLMLKYGVDDIRKLYDGDLRLVTQF